MPEYESERHTGDAGNHHRHPLRQPQLTDQPR
jgi:hypothetical protein